MKSPLVTIIVPTFNRAGMLGETLQSVVNQSYDHLEVIVVDDGSTDDTPAMIDALQPKLDRSLSLITQPNAGEARAVNRGWLEAQGEYVCVVSSDDPQPEHLIERSVHYLEKNPNCVVSYPDWTVINEAGAPIRDVTGRSFDQRKLLVELECLPGPGSVIRRESVLEHRPLLRDPRYRFANDLECWMSLSLFGQFLHIPEKLGQWRSHSGTVSAEIQHVEEAASRLTLAHEFFSRPDLAADVAALGSEARRLQLARLVHCSMQVDPMNPALTQVLLRALRPPAYRVGMVEKIRQIPRRLARGRGLERS